MFSPVLLPLQLAQPPPKGVKAARHPLKLKLSRTGSVFCCYVGLMHLKGGLVAFCRLYRQALWLLQRLCISACKASKGDCSLSLASVWLALAA